MKQNFQKMALVPLETVNRQSVVSPNERQLSKLDMDMNSVLKRNIPNDQKLKLYRRALSDYIFVHNKVFPNQLSPMKNHTAIDTTDSSSFEHVSPQEYVNEEQNNDVLDDSSIITLDDSSIIPLPENDIPYRTSTPILPTHQDKGEKTIDEIVKNLNKHPEILRWNEGTQEIVYKGAKVPNSNIIDLLSNQIYSSQQPSNPPHGAHEFNAALQEIRNLNYSYESNRKGKQLISKQRRNIAKSPYTRPAVRKPSNDEIQNLIIQALQKPKVVAKNRKRKVVNDSTSSEPLTKQVKLHLRNKRKFEELYGKPPAYLPRKRKALPKVEKPRRPFTEDYIRSKVMQRLTELKKRRTKLNHKNDALKKIRTTLKLKKPKWTTI